MRQSTWIIGGASARGATHLRTGRPNQDAVIWSPAAGQGGRIVGAVSDGHGAKAYFRSDVGSRLAVETARALLVARFDNDAHDDGALAGDILRVWRESVEAHLDQNPYPDDMPAQSEPRLSPYGATLLTIAADDGDITVLQIGDGDLMLGYPDGRVERPLRADVGLSGEETYSLCQDDAETRFRVASLWRAPDQPWPDFALLASDGVAKSYPDDAAFANAVARIRELAISDWAGLLAGLSDWLSELSSKGSGDDATLCLAARAPSLPESTQP